MTQVIFTRWCLDPKGRTPVSINPTFVRYAEHYGEPFTAATGEEFPAATRIAITRAEFLVQGAVADVVKALNDGEKSK